VLQNVGVTADEFTLQLSRPGVPRGRVRVAFRNAGEDPHDLPVREEAALASVLSFPALPPAGEARQAASLPAGRYLLWCSLEGHADLGMRTTLQVW
jgi:uncharacterized cupredoxin-like copper-binding protein